MGNNLCSCLLTDDKEYDKESNREKDKCENDLVYTIQFNF